jgi:hypothetical protein
MITSEHNVSKELAQKFQKARELYGKYEKLTKQAEKVKEQYDTLVASLLGEDKEYFFADGAKIFKKITPRYKYSEEAIIAELGDDALLRVSEIQAKKLEMALIEKYGDEQIAEAKLKNMRVCVKETESYSFNDGKLTEKQIAFQKKQLEKQLKMGLIDEQTFEQFCKELEAKAK